jgi:hypothetical protein
MDIRIRYSLNEISFNWEANPYIRTQYVYVVILSVVIYYFCEDEKQFHRRIKMARAFA